MTLGWDSFPIIHDKQQFVQYLGRMNMREFMVRFRSFRDIQEFVALASGQPLKLRVGSDRFQINATSFMGMFALNCRKPLRVAVDCSQEEFDALLITFGRFLAN